VGTLVVRGNLERASGPRGVLLEDQHDLLAMQTLLLADDADDSSQVACKPV
jgi:hypothetical protein